ncbi:MAG: ribosome small subunit-dependent GTPase A [Clostridia bacterium]|nr:ribosome small subunit-dependent GTPase A [Clostridia bacterium]
MQGVIIKAISGFYYVETDKGIIECKARGRFRNDGTSPLVGDRVIINLSGKSGTIESINERKNMLSRPPIANIDKLFIVSSAVIPAPNTVLIDRMTSICEYKNIEPIIVFNKTDLGEVESLKKIYLNAGFKTIVCSALTGEGIDEIKKELSGCICAFTGNSGVGKSSILNLIFSTLNLSTSDVSEKLGRGRHTTRHTELFSHEFGGYVADTPGFSSVENDKFDLEFRDLLPTLFRDFEEHRQTCKFHDCKHVAEKGCGVIEAVKAGEIEKTRYDSYLAIYNELRDVKPWEVRR